ncbi:MAG: hypothetical protein ACR2NA_07035 [Solirubrobacterales bacterium]
MTVGASIVLIAVGAILRYAVDFSFPILNIQVVGLILMLAGIAALVLSIAFELLRYGNSEPHDRVRSDERARSHDRSPHDDPTRRL